MKKLILMLIIVVATITAKAQQYQSTFDPIPLEFMKQQFDRRQAAYDANLQYAQEIYNWCEELIHLKGTDAKFRQDVIKQRTKLLKLKAEDLSVLGNQLKAIDSNIDLAIRMYKYRYEQHQRELAKNETK